ncbi:hypothetical protein [Staphylococcus coagulans]|uniref:hypothetical protein n=1 Tax=Staphylococcus coagulans TaxID=74706 RepID=UPI0015FC5CCE|nr:hypothetical protein [Staphylococcus coagulans]MBA8760769.1 hypothetical protein [Staphylococcus coagulans]MBA8762916.1 hypothetical protein [Staphylococcus coagulans]MBA8769507.1 hypothetical protein [Staphylococcus coagulans]MBA8772075.1 hypothetical protein [Staphylococcus coagulans]
MNYKDKMDKMGWNIEEILKRINSLNDSENNIEEKDLKDMKNEKVKSFFNLDKTGKD